VDALLADPDIDIVVELIGGLEPARTLLIKAIENGKQVATANKALLAHHGVEIFAAAREAGVGVAFEASVGGGIPLIRSLRDRPCRQPDHSAAWASSTAPATTSSPA
jgi:homoserine dehydrogenase